MDALSSFEPFYPFNPFKFGDGLGTITPPTPPQPYYGLYNYMTFPESLELLVAGPFIVLQSLTDEQVQTAVIKSTAAFGAI